MNDAADLQFPLKKKESDLKQKALMYSGMYGRSKTQAQLDKNRQQFDKYRTLHSEVLADIELVDTFILDFKALPE